MAATPGRGATTIRFAQFITNPDEQVWWQGGLERFRERNPEISVTHEPAPWGQYWQRLSIFAAANMLPDTLLMVTQYVRQYERQSAVRDLFPFVKVDWSLDRADQWRPIQRAVTIEGKGPYQLQYDLSTYCVYLNRNLFKKLGVPDPTERLPDYWTIDEFRDAAVRLTGPAERGTQYGLLVPFQLGPVTDALLRSHGGGLLDASQTKCLLAAPESIELMEQLAALYTKHRVAAGQLDNRTGGLFEGGRAAMEIAGPERALRYRERIKDFEWDVAPLPVSSRTRTRTNAIDGGGIAMSPTTFNIEPAWRFLSYLTSADNLAEMIGKSSRGIPGRPSVKDSLIRADRPPKNSRLFIDAIEVGVCTSVSDWDAFMKLLEPTNYALLNSDRPVADLLRDLAPRVDAFLVRT